MLRTNQHFLNSRLGIFKMEANDNRQIYDETAIRATVDAYIAAINSADTSSVKLLYATDDVIIGTPAESLDGVDAVGIFYNRAFLELSFDVTLSIDEIVMISSSYAYVWTHSSGTIRHLGTGVKFPQANHDLFVLRKDPDAGWRIARHGRSPLISATVG